MMGLKILIFIPQNLRIWRGCRGVLDRLWMKLALLGVPVLLPV